MLKFFQESKSIVIPFVKEIVSAYEVYQTKRKRLRVVRYIRGELLEWGKRFCFCYSEQKKAARRSLSIHQCIAVCYIGKY